MNLTREDKEALLKAIEVLAKLFAPQAPSPVREALPAKPKKSLVQTLNIVTEKPTPAVSTKNRLIPLTKWNNYHDFPPVGGLRHLVFYAEQNGFNRVIRRIGRRVLIDEAAFFKWVDESKK